MTTICFSLTIYRTNFGVSGWEPEYLDRQETIYVTKQPSTILPPGGPKVPYILLPQHISRPYRYWKVIDESP